MHSPRAAAVLLALCAAMSLPALAATSPANSAAPTTPACPAIPLAGADAGAVRTPSAADAWGGPRADDAATLSDRVVAYSIDAELDRSEEHTSELQSRENLVCRLLLEK